MSGKLTISRRARSTPPSGIGEIFNKALSFPDVIHLEVGEPDFDTPSNIKEAGCQAIREGDVHYTHSRGTLELRNAVVEYYKREYNVELEVSDVIISQGGIASLLLSILVLMDPEDELLVPDPGYPPYSSLASVLGIKVVRYPVREENGFVPRIEDIEERIGKRIKAILINTPNNPTGTTYPHEFLSSLAKVVRDYDIFLISDEVYERLTYDEVRHHTMLKFGDIEDRVIVINSFSKSYAMTGWRLGFLVTKNREITDMLDGVQGYTLISPSSISQRAGIAALLGPQEEVEKMRRIYEERRNLLVSLLEDVPYTSFVKPMGAFYLFLNVSHYSQDTFSLAEDLLIKKRVAVAPGATFGPSGEGYIRLSFTTKAEKIREGVERIKDYLISLE